MEASEYASGLRRVQALVEGLVKAEAERIEAEVGSLRGDLEEAAEEVRAYLKERKNDVAVVGAVHQRLLRLRQRLRDAERSAKQLRLGGSCSHGADKGKCCELCFSRHGRLHGPYSMLPDGLEVAEFMFRELEEARSSMRKRPKVEGVSRTHISFEMDRITQLLQDVDGALRECEDVLIGLQRKFEIMRKMTSGTVSFALPAVSKAEKRLERASEILSADNFEDAEVKALQPKKISKMNSKLQSDSKPNSDASFRNIVVDVNDFLRFEFYCVRKDAHRERNKELLQRILGNSVRKTPIITADTLFGLQKLVELRFKQLTGLSCKAGSFRRESQEPTPSDKQNLFELIHEGSQGRFALKVYPEKSKTMSAVELFQKLCALSKYYWTAGLQIDESTCTHIATILGSQQSAKSCVVAAQGLRQAEAVAVFNAIAYSNSNIEAFDIGMNPLFRCAGFAGLSNVRFLSFANISLSTKETARLLELVQTKGTLEELDLRFLPIAIVKCVCHSSGSGECKKQMQNVETCCKQLGELVKEARNLQRLRLDGSINCQKNLECNHSSTFESGMELLQEGLKRISLQAVTLSLSLCVFPNIGHFTLICACLLWSQSSLYLRFDLCEAPNVQQAITNRKFAPSLLLRKDSSLFQTSSILSMCFRGCRNLFDSEDFRCLGILMKGGKFPCLRKLDFSGCNLDDKGMHEVLQAAKYVKALAYLNVNENPKAFSVEMLSILMEDLNLVIKESQIVTLRVSCIGICAWDHFLAWVVAACASSTALASCLKNLEIGTTSFGPKAVRRLALKDLAQWLRKGSGSLQKLRISGAQSVLDNFEILSPSECAPPSFEDFVEARWEQGSVQAYCETCDLNIC